MAYTESRSAPITIYSRQDNDSAQDVVSTRRSFSMSPIGGATGAMKKFLSRRRGNTGEGYGSTESLPRLQAFEIVGGNGSISPGTMVYDVEPLHSPRSSVKISVTANSPASPKSPTLQTMFGRFGRGRTHSRLGSMTETQGLAPSATEKAWKKLNRRSLSADSLPPFRAESCGTVGGAPKEQKIHPLAVGPGDSFNGNTISPVSGVNHLTNNMSAANALLESDPEFFHNSAEFLNMHHSRSYTEDWAKRNKRHTAISRRQSESSLLNIISEPYESSDNHNCGVWDRTLGVGASSESLPLPLTSLSSPTQYYDCPQTRNVVRFYLANNEYQFDEMLESGFPSRSLRLAEETTEDSHFMTLRLTLTPWHARAEESQLYGPENTAKPPHLRSMVYKLFSRSSSSLLLSTSPPTPSSVSSIARQHVAKDSIYSGVDDVGARGDRSLSFSSTSSVFTPPTASPIPGESRAHTKKLRGPTRDRGFRIIATSNNSESPMSPTQTRDYQYLSSPPLTPVQQRSGSLSALSLPIYASDEPSPPIPARRKASTPALFYSVAQGNTSSLSLPETIERPRSAVPSKSGLRKATTPGPPVDANPLVDTVPFVASKNARHPHRADCTPALPRQRQPHHKYSDPTLSSTMTTSESDVDGIDNASSGHRYDSPPITPPSSFKQTDDACQHLRHRQQLSRSNVPPMSPQHQVDISPSRPSPDNCHRSAPPTPMNPHVLAPWQYQEPTSNAWTSSHPGNVQSLRSSHDLQQQYQQNHYNLQQQQQRWHQSRSQQQQQQQEPPCSPLNHQAKHPLSPTAIDGRDRARVFSVAHPRPHEEPSAQAPRVGEHEDRRRNMSVPSISTGHTVAQPFDFP
ncbi:hypothetical protein BGZ74_007930 [Mortierella antarctica]|nr:hypothetical protein BGZ74_007930 [Mortierella antarctica]